MTTLIYEISHTLYPNYAILVYRDNTETTDKSQPYLFAHVVSTTTNEVLFTTNTYYNPNLNILIDLCNDFIKEQK